MRAGLWRIFARPEDKDFKATDAHVIGVSPDGIEKQQKFVEKHKLTVRLFI
jgi:peroxiredoxin